MCLVLFIFLSCTILDPCLISTVTNYRVSHRHCITIAAGESEVTTTQTLETHLPKLCQQLRQESGTEKRGWCVAQWAECHRLQAQQSAMDTGLNPGSSALLILLPDGNAPAKAASDLNQRDVCPQFAKWSPRYFVILGVIVNGIMVFNLIPACSLLVNSCVLV